jgi:hypothetical protein
VAYYLSGREKGGGEGGGVFPTQSPPYKYLRAEYKTEVITCILGLSFLARVMEAVVRESSPEPFNTNIYYTNDSLLIYAGIWQVYQCHSLNTGALSPASRIPQMGENPTCHAKIKLQYSQQYELIIC